MAKKDKNPKFIQIITGTWRSGNELTNHNLYALGEDGKVYQFYSKLGWKEKQVYKNTEENFKLN